MQKGVTKDCPPTESSTQGSPRAPASLAITRAQAERRRLETERKQREKAEEKRLAREKRERLEQEKREAMEQQGLARLAETKKALDEKRRVKAAE